MKKQRKNNNRPNRQHIETQNYVLASGGSITTGGDQTIAFTILGPLGNFRVTSLVLDYTSNTPVVVQLSLRGTTGSSSDASARSMLTTTFGASRRITLRQPRKTDWCSDDAEAVHIAWLYVQGNFSETAVLRYSIIIRYSQRMNSIPTGTFAVHHVAHAPAARNLTQS